MINPARVSRYAVALVVIGGAIWVIAGLAYGSILAACYPSCGSQVLASGSTTSYPASAVSNLAWEDFYALLYAAVIGLLTITIGLKAFKQGQKWAWYAILFVGMAGLFTGLLDYLSWGGWYTFLFLGLPPLLGLMLSVKSFFNPLKAA